MAEAKTQITDVDLAVLLRLIELMGRRCRVPIPHRV